MMGKPRAGRQSSQIVNGWREPIHEWAVILADEDGTRRVMSACLNVASRIRQNNGHDCRSD